METITHQVNSISFTISAKAEQISLSSLFFSTLKTLPVEKIKDGDTYALGFSVFVFKKIEGGFQVMVPDYQKDPLGYVTEDCSLDLWIMQEQAQLLQYCGIMQGAATRFDDLILFADDAIHAPDIRLHRFSDLDDKNSGWCMETLIKTEDGEWETAEPQEYRGMYAFQLLHLRPSLLKMLALPYDTTVMVHGDDITAILDENGKNYLKKSK